jgi:hypothetical protein
MSRRDLLCVEDGDAGEKKLLSHGRGKKNVRVMVAEARENQVTSTAMSPL